ncbi:MAG TPA: hypothetical protein VJ921_06945, partial [Vicinamibacteria bacterium]|nr:hypothetical protein [Vicinamibacteria bacterium]
MKTDWIRPTPELSQDSAPVSETLRVPRARSIRPWRLYVGESEELLERAATTVIDWTLPVISPPRSLPLAVAVEALPAPAIDGERVLYAPRIEQGLLDGALSATSSLYLLPRLSQVASEGAPLTVVATAIESELERRAPHVLRQRGLASRFEIRRVAGGSGAGRELPQRDLDGAPAELSRAKTLEALRSAVAQSPDLPC